MCDYLQGEVAFDLNGIRKHDIVSVLQYRNGTCTQQCLYTIASDYNSSEGVGLVEIGSIDVSASMGPYNLTYVPNQNSSTVFPGMS